MINSVVSVVYMWRPKVMVSMLKSSSSEPGLSSGRGSLQCRHILGVQVHIFVNYRLPSWIWQLWRIEARKYLPRE